MNRIRLTLVLLLSLIVGVLFVGCNTDGSTTGNGDTDEDVTLSFIHWRGEDVEVFEEIISKFEDEYTNITINMEAFPSEQYNQTLQTKIRGAASGDVFTIFPGQQFETVTNAGLVYDITEEDFVDRFHSHYIEVGSKNGKQYALPYHLVFNMPIYNKTMFEEFGLELPTDWDGFLELNETLLANGVETPILFPAADIGPGQFMNTMMMNNAPEEDIWIKVENGESKVTEEWWVKTLAQIKELDDKGYFGNDPVSLDKDVSGTLFAQEKGAMLATGSYMMEQVNQINPDIELGLMAPITVNEDEAVWEGIHNATFMLALNEETKYKDEAKKFIEFLTREEIAKFYAESTGQMSTLKGMEYDSVILEATTSWTERNTRLMPRSTLTISEVESAVTNSIEAVLTGKSPEEAAETAQQVINQAID